MTSLKSLLTRTFLVLALAPLLVAGMLLGGYFVTRTYHFARQVEELRAGEAAVRVRDVFSDLEKAATGLTRYRDFFRLPLPERRDLLLELMSAEPMIREIALLDAAGRELLRLSDVEPDAMGAMRSWSGRPEFELPGSGRSYYSPVTAHPDSGEPSMQAALPLVDQASGETAGVLVMSLRLDVIRSILSAYALLPQESLYMTNTDGMIVVHRNPSVILARICVALPGAGGSRLSTRCPQGILRVVRAGAEVAVGQQRFTIVADRGLAEALRPAMAAGAMLLGMLCSATLLAIILVRRGQRLIGDPILRLTDTALAIRDGDLTRRAQAGGTIEGDLLAAAFNDMTERLNGSLASLEREIDLRESAQRELLRSQSLLSLHLDTTPVGCIFWDLMGRVTEWNPAAEAIFGYSRDEAMGKSGSELIIVPRHEQRMLGVFGSILDGTGGARSTNENRTADGRIITCEWHNTRLFDEGRLIGVASLVLDVSQRLESEQRLKDSLAEKETLLKEIHHRVKNNLQIITSLLKLQDMKAADPRLSVLLEETTGRIRSMALVHEELYRSKDLARVDLKSYLEQLCSKLSASMNPRGDVHVTVRCDLVRLGIEQAIPLGIVVNELMTNSFKYAFPDGRAGTLEVFAHAEGERLRVGVADNGAGLPAELDIAQASTLGLQLVTSLARQLDAVLGVVREGGTRIVLEFPLRHAQS